MADKTTDGVAGEPRSMQSTILETGAAMTQEFAPLNQICAHLNALHVYASDPKRSVQANHYCAHISEDVRQCLIYDTAAPNARLIGIEYMVTPRIYESLPSSERKLWHSHVFEVKSGMLIMPTPNLVPTAAWEVAETKEMEQVVTLYGKIYHLWQTDRGDKVPLGEPQLMTSFADEGAFNQGDGPQKVAKRNEEMGVDMEQKKEKRAYIQEPKIHPDADQTWKK